MKDLVYVALSQFCEGDDTPRQKLLRAGLEVRQNPLGRRLKYEEIVSAVGDAAAVIAGLEPYDASILASLPRLRCISRCGVGTDTIDLEAAKRHRVEIFTTPDEVAEPVAQLTVGMILALARNLSKYSLNQRQGIWQRYDGHVLKEWTIGLAGFGRIGRCVANYLRPFNSRVLVADPAVRLDDLPAGVELVEFDTLLTESDLISVHVARRPDEGALMDISAFDRMKNGSYLVNTSRGYLIDEDALFAALQSGKLAGAGLDVYQHEPFAGPLLALPQVLCTPHIGTLTDASRRAMELRSAENVIQFLKGATSSLATT